VHVSFYASGHRAWWGRQAAQVQSTIGGWVATYQPDIILVLLGFNDLGWFVSGPDGLIGSMGHLIEPCENEADVQILVGNDVDPVFVDGREDLGKNTKIYNAQLKATLPSWFQWESPIAYVDVNSYYRCRLDACANGCDGLHPNSTGEYRIAHAFAYVLKYSFGIKGSNFVSPATGEPRIIGTPLGTETETYPEGLYAHWACDDYARGYEIRSRITGMTDW
jgi:lysophospholipase L1-like esterase